MGVKKYRLGLNAKTLGISFVIALLVVSATVLTARAFERLHNLVDQLTRVEVENLMASVRIAQQAESLISLGLVLSTAQTQHERRSALVELNDRTTWIGQMSADVSMTHLEPEMLKRIDEIQRELDVNIRLLNHLVRERIEGRSGAGELEQLREVSQQNRQLAGEMSVLMGYFAAQVRLQITSQSDDLQQQIKNHQHKLMVLAVFIVIFALIAGVYFDMTVVRRILRMQRAVSKPVVNPHDFEQQGQDEIGLLSQNVVNFVERIRQQEAHMKKINEELSFLAEHDSLTGLANRRHFHAAARRLLRQSHLSVCVAIGDIDHFKEINDQRGHAVGDIALKSLADVLTNGLRETDTLARFGGEEFAAIFSVQCMGDALKIFDNLRQTIENQPVEIPDQPKIWLTCSFGLSIIEDMPMIVNASEDKTDAVLNAALLAADEALYEAKTSGRNRICVASSPVSATSLSQDQES